MAWPSPGMALAMMVVRVTALLVMVSLAPPLALALLALLALLLLLLLPALVLVGTQARRLELKTRRRLEASGLVRGWR